VSVGAELFTIVDASELELAGQVGVEEASRVRAGQRVSFTLDAYPDRVFEGRVDRVDPTSDPGTRQVGVYIRLPNPGNRIIGGQFAQGRIEIGGTTSAIMIPEAAVINRTADSAQVFVVAGDRLARRSVRLGDRDETSASVAVLSGLQAGDRVLLNPSSNTDDGTPVTIAADTARGGAR
jgi:RND family efflux transporter MFP subunit